jgi:WD40 repeat protein
MFYYDSLNTYHEETISSGHQFLLPYWFWVYCYVCFMCSNTKLFSLFQVWGVKYSPDGSKIVSVAEDRSINVYDCQI